MVITNPIYGSMVKAFRATDGAETDSRKPPRKIIAHNKELSGSTMRP